MFAILILILDFNIRLLNHLGKFVRNADSHMSPQNHNLRTTRVIECSVGWVPFEINEEFLKALNMAGLLGPYGPLTWESQ